MYIIEYAAQCVFNKSILCITAVCTHAVSAHLPISAQNMKFCFLDVHTTEMSNQSSNSSSFSFLLLPSLFSRPQQVGLYSSYKQARVNSTRLASTCRVQIRHELFGVRTWSTLPRAPPRIQVRVTQVK